MSEENGQTTIYDVPHARVSDPGTSWASARKTEEQEGTTTTFRPGTLKHLALRAIADEPRTAAQVESVTGKRGIWKRVSDLKNAELIVASRVVHDFDTDRDVTQYMVTVVGVRVLRSLDIGQTVKL